MAEFEPMVGRYLTLTVEGRDHRIYFEEAGSGIPLVCLHTAGAHASQFRHILCDPAVTDYFRVLAFDLPWHGKSNPPVGWQNEDYQLTSEFYAATVMGFVNALELERPVIMGCSMGGRMVIRLAVEQGPHLTAVIGLESTDRPTPWYDDNWTDHPEFKNGDFCAALVSGLCAASSPNEFRWETLWHYYQGGTGVFKGDMYFFRTDSDYESLSSRIDTEPCPVYLMTGEYDFSCRPEDTIRTANRIPGAEAIIMKGLGHFPMSENPEAFREYLLPILDQIKVGR